MILFPFPPASITEFEMRLLAGPNSDGAERGVSDKSREPEKLTRTLGSSSIESSSTKWTVMTAIVDWARRNGVKNRSAFLERVLGRWNDEVGFILWCLRRISCFGNLKLKNVN